MFDWFRWLADSSHYMPRGSCGDWPDVLRSAWVYGNAVIAAAYFAIPVALMVLWVKRRQDIDHPWVLVAFAAFVSSCGITHINEVIVWWYPAYRMFTVAVVACAALSAFTAMTLPSVVHALINQPTWNMYRKLNERLHIDAEIKDRAIEALRENRAQLSRRISDLEAMRRNGVWVASQEKELSLLLDIARERKGQDI